MMDTKFKQIRLAIGRIKLRNWFFIGLGLFAISILVFWGFAGIGQLMPHDDQSQNTMLVISLILFFVPFFSSALILVPIAIYWFVNGLVGGYILTRKKTLGASSIAVGIAVGISVFLWNIPLILWLVFMIIMGFTGKAGRRFAMNAKPSKKQCVQCKGWNDYTATRCRHCSQPLADITTV